MISRSNAKLSDQIILARKHFRLSLTAMAAELRIRPEWLSRIINGHERPSYNIGLRFQDFLRRHGQNPSRFHLDSKGAFSFSEGGEAAPLRSAILNHCHELVNACGEDTARLGLLLTKIGAIRMNRPKRTVTPKMINKKKQDPSLPKARATPERTALIKERLRALNEADE